MNGAKTTQKRRKNDAKTTQKRRKNDAKSDAKTTLTLNDDTVGPDALQVSVDVDEVEGVAGFGQADGRLLQVRRAVAVRTDRVTDDPPLASLRSD